MPQEPKGRQVLLMDIIQPLSCLLLLLHHVLLLTMLLSYQLLLLLLIDGCNQGHSQAASVIACWSLDPGRGQDQVALRQQQQQPWELVLLEVRGEGCCSSSFCCCSCCISEASACGAGFRGPGGNRLKNQMCGETGGPRGSLGGDILLRSSAAVPDELPGRY